MRKKLIFSDIDLTLIHDDPDNRFENIPLSGEKRYLSKLTQDLLKNIKQDGHIILSSGRRPSAYELVRGALSHDFAILEQGCVIMKGDGTLDQVYMSRFQEYFDNNLVEKYKKKLQQNGVELLDEERVLTFRLKIKDHSVYEQISKTQDQNFRLIKTEDYIYFVPSNGGKEIAVDYTLKKFNPNEHQLFAIGDNLNDIGMLELIAKLGGTIFTFSNAEEEVIEKVRQFKGYISQEHGHQGIQEILNLILKK